MNCDKHYWEGFDKQHKMFSLPKRLSEEKVTKYVNYWNNLNVDEVKRKRMFEAFEICDYILDNRKRKSISITARLNDLIAKYEKSSEDLLNLDSQLYDDIDLEEASILEEEYID